MAGVQPQRQWGELHAAYEGVAARVEGNREPAAVDSNPALKQDFAQMPACIAAFEQTIVVRPGKMQVELCTLPFPIR